MANVMVFLLVALFCAAPALGKMLAPQLQVLVPVRDFDLTRSQDSPKLSRTRGVKFSTTASHCC